MDWFRRDAGRIVVTALAQLGVATAATWMIRQLSEPGSIRTVVVGLVWIAVIVVGGWVLIHRAEGGIKLTGAKSQDEATPRDTLQYATEKDLAQPYLKDRRFRLVDVPTNNGRIVNRTWENCLIEGPAVVWFNESMFSDFVIQVPGGGTDLEPALFERQDGPVTGVLIIERCTIRSCTIRNVGFLGSKASLDHMRDVIPGS